MSTELYHGDVDPNHPVFQICLGEELRKPFPIIINVNAPDPLGVTIKNVPTVSSFVVGGAMDTTTKSVYDGMLQDGILQVRTTPNVFTVSSPPTPIVIGTTPTFTSTPVVAREDQREYRELKQRADQLARQNADKDQTIAEQQQKIAELERECKAFEQKKRDETLSLLLNETEPFDWELHADEPSAN